MNRNYGWRPDLPSFKDYRFGVVHAPAAATYPAAAMDLVPRLPARLDQGPLGSCVGNSHDYEAALLWPGLIGSRLWTYYQARKMEGTIKQDAGCMNRDGAKVLATLGLPPETDMPYDVARFTRRPPAKATRDAKKHVASSYSRLSNRDDYRRCLADGHGFVIGVSVYDSFESDAVAATGRIPLPAKGETLLGGHSIFIAGYNSHSPIGDAYYFPNSWTDKWGIKGDAWIPAAYIENPDLADDAWTLRA